MPAAGAAPRDRRRRGRRAAGDAKAVNDESGEEEALQNPHGDTSEGLGPVSSLTSTHRDPVFRPGDSAGGFLSIRRFKDRCVRATEKEVTRLTVSPDFQDWLQKKVHNAGRGARWGVVGFAVMFFVATIAALERNAKLQLVEQKMVLAGGGLNSPTATDQAVVADYCKGHVSDLEKQKVKMKKEISDLMVKAGGAAAREADLGSKEALLQTERKKFEQEKAQWEKAMDRKSNAARAAQAQIEADEKKIQSMEEHLDKQKTIWRKQQASKDEELVRAMEQIHSDRENLASAQKQFASEKGNWKRTSDARSSELLAAELKLVKDRRAFEEERQQTGKVDANGTNMQVRRLREELSLMREQVSRAKTREGELQVEQRRLQAVQDRLQADEARLAAEQELMAEEGAQHGQAPAGQHAGARPTGYLSKEIIVLRLLCSVLFVLLVNVLLSKRQKDRELMNTKSESMELHKKEKARALHLPEQFVDPPRSGDEVEFANGDAERQSRDRNNRLKVKAEAREELIQENSRLGEITRDLDEVRERNRELKEIAAEMDRLKKESLMLAPAKQRQAELEAAALEEKVCDLGKVERKCLDLKARCKQLQEVADSVPELEAQMAKLEDAAAERSEVLYEVEQRALKVTQLEAEIREKEQVADRLPALEREMSLVLQQAAEAQTLEEEADELERIASTLGAVRGRNSELKQQVAEVNALEEECKDLANAAEFLDTMRAKSELLRKQAKDAQELQSRNARVADELKATEEESASLRGVADRLEVALQEQKNLKAKASKVEELEEDCDRLRQVAGSLGAFQQEKAVLAKQVEEAKAAAEESKLLAEELRNKQEDVARLEALVDQLPGVRQKYEELQEKVKELRALEQDSKKLAAAADSLDSPGSRDQTQDAKTRDFEWDHRTEAHARPSQDPEALSDPGDAITESTDSSGRRRMQVKYRSRTPTDNLALPKKGWQHKEGLASARSEGAGSRIPQPAKGPVQKEDPESVSTKLRK